MQSDGTMTLRNWKPSSKKLANTEPLEERYCDHALEGKWNV